MHLRCTRRSTPLRIRAGIRTLARPEPGLLPLLIEKFASHPRPGRRGVDTTTTARARRPRSTLSHPGIFAAHSRLRPCRRDAEHPARTSSSLSSSRESRCRQISGLSSAPAKSSCSRRNGNWLPGNPRCSCHRLNILWNLIIELWLFVSAAPFSTRFNQNF